jgi:hypothetical protein
MTYPNLTACGSGPEARICTLLILFERKHFEVCGNVKLRYVIHEINVNTLDLVKDNTKKKSSVFNTFKSVILNTSTLGLIWSLNIVYI